MSVFYLPRAYAFNNGAVESGAKLNFYEAGTTTRKNTYSDQALTTLNTNPVVADSFGVFGPIYLTGGLYKVVLSTADDTELWTQDNVEPAGSEEDVSVKNFGALGDGSTDDATAIQACFDYVLANGGVAYFPPGEYVCGSRLDFIETDISHDEFTKGSIRGAGPGASVIRFTGTTTATAGIRFQPPDTSSGFLDWVYMKDIRIMNNIGTRVGTGLQFDNVAFCYFENVYITGWDFAIDAVDTLSSNFVGCYFRLNKHGGRFQISDSSRPNALTFTGCNIANSEYGLYILQPTSVDIRGGAIEGNGFAGTGATAEKWGVRIDDGGRGGAAINFTSVYFEKTVGQADLWIDQNGATNSTGATYNLTSCNLQRIDGTEFCLNNIFVESAAGPVYLNLRACGFKGFNDYTPQADRQYIRFQEEGGNIIFNSDGCLYESSLEDPTTRTVTGPGSILPQNPETYIVTTGTDAYTLADGVQGERIFILCTGFVGNGTLTPTSLGGGTTVTFTAAGQFAILEWHQNDWWFTGGTATLA